MDTEMEDLTQPVSFRELERSADDDLSDREDCAAQMQGIHLSANETIVVPSEQMEDFTTMTASLVIHDPMSEVAPRTTASERLSGSEFPDTPANPGFTRNIFPPTTYPHVPPRRHHSSSPEGSGYLEREIPQERRWVLPHTNIFCGPSAYRSPSSDEGEYLEAAFPEECRWIPEPELMKPAVVGGPSVQSPSHRELRSSSSQEGDYLEAAFPEECRWIPEPELMKPAVVGGPSVQSTSHRKPRSSSSQEGDYLEAVFAEERRWIPEPELLKRAVVGGPSVQWASHHIPRSSSSQEGDYLEAAFPEQRRWISDAPIIQPPVVGGPGSHPMHKPIGAGDRDTIDPPAHPIEIAPHGTAHGRMQSPPLHAGSAGPDILMTPAHLDLPIPPETPVHKFKGKQRLGGVSNPIIIDDSPPKHSKRRPPGIRPIQTKDSPAPPARRRPPGLRPDAKPVKRCDHIKVIPPAVRYPNIDFIDRPGLHKAARGPHPVDPAGYPWPNFNNIADADKPGAGILSLPADPALTSAELLHCHNSIEGLAPEMPYVRAAAFLYTSRLHQLRAEQAAIQCWGHQLIRGTRHIVWPSAASAAPVLYDTFSRFAEDKES
ncbi:hypothetical protein M413DRAFT_32033 [Hebeloma cylindrosporum]|uniref:Uncharacterized protein n=1 Tax=Hebeloma cylindrosporum TaxID=76867 RepID=A0A0C3BGY1_HEBCY|nr:hypothetical protein M413DRAFT_32033 [Hebeloma cylindrosporum h7]